MEVTDSFLCSTARTNERHIFTKGSFSAPLIQQHIHQQDTWVTQKILCGTFQCKLYQNYRDWWQVHYPAGFLKIKWSLGAQERTDVHNATCTCSKLPGLQTPTVLGDGLCMGSALALSPAAYFSQQLSFFSHSLDGGMKQESKGTLQQDFSLGCLHWKPICTPSLKPEGRLDYSKCRCLVRAGPPTREGRLREESCGVLPLAQLFSEE